MAVALKKRGIDFQQQVPIPIWFHGQTIGHMTLARRK